MEKFVKLGLSQEVLKILEESGFESPTEIQEKTIPLALAGKDIIGGSSTGSGKTLAFASPIIENLKSNGSVQALILTPTRELAEQVADSIKKFSRNKKLRTLAVYGGVKIETQLRKIGDADIVVGTPGRILDHMTRRSLRLNKIKILVLDEVDRMFDMGFHRDVEKIIKECPTERQTMLFSATISSDVDYFANKYTKNAVKVSVKSYVDDLKLKQSFYDVADGLKFSLLVHLLKKEKGDLVMVFCSTRRNVDFVTGNLIKNKIYAKAIHGGMEQSKRLNVLKEFHSKEGVNVLVCTDVAARGLDIDRVSHVYNYDLPSKADDYIHRIGRTARAGKEGKAIILLSSRDYDNFSIILRNKSLKIEEEKLPFLDRVEIDKNAGDKLSGYGRSRGNDSSRGRFGGNRSSGGRRESSGDNRSRGRSSGTRGNSSSRSRSSSGGRDESSRGRSSGNRSSGGRSRSPRENTSFTRRRGR